MRTYGLTQIIIEPRRVTDKSATLPTYTYAYADNDMLLTLHGFNDASSVKLSNIPSFIIQSLRDQIPGQKFSTDELLSDSIESTYYTPVQLIYEINDSLKYYLTPTTLMNFKLYCPILNILLMSYVSPKPDYIILSRSLTFP